MANGKSMEQLKRENEELREIINDAERVFSQLDEIRQRYKKYLSSGKAATVEDENEVKTLLEKYSQL